MEQNEETTWVLMLFGGMFFSGLAISTLAIAIACSLSAIRGRFPAFPVLIYWMFCGIACASLAFVDEYVAFWFFILMSPVFAGLFWYYDEADRESNLKIIQDGLR